MKSNPNSELVLVEPEKQEIISSNIFEILKQTRAENTWLSNFSSVNTKDAYKRAVASFIATLNISNPEELYATQQAHVIAWRGSMEKAGLSQATIANRLSALSSLFRVLTDQQLCFTNPVTGVKRPKTGNGGIGSGKSPSLTRQQVRSMLDAPNQETDKGIRDQALLHVYFYTGARCSEPGNLKVKDLSFDREYATLNFTIKGNKRNTIAIHPECHSALLKHLERSQITDELEAYIFTAMYNGKPEKPLSRKQCWTIFNAYALKAGLPDGVYPHVARSTFITEAFENGVQGEAIQRTVGHSSITTTEGYNHTTIKHRDSASLKMGF